MLIADSCRLSKGYFLFQSWMSDGKLRMLNNILMHVLNRAIYTRKISRERNHLYCSFTELLILSRNTRINGTKIYG